MNLKLVDWDAIAEFRCIALVDSRRTFWQKPFGLLNEQILAHGMIYAVIRSDAAMRALAAGFSAAQGLPNGTYTYVTKNCDEMRRLCASASDLPCSGLALPLALSELCSTMNLFDGLGVITNPNSGSGKRFAALQKRVEKARGAHLLLTFSCKTDVVRLYFSETSVECVQAAVTMFQPSQAVVIGGLLNEQ